MKLDKSFSFLYGYRNLLFLLLLPPPILVSIFGCVGPTSPFGAIHQYYVPSFHPYSSSVSDNPTSESSNHLPTPSIRDQNGFYSPQPSPPKIYFFPNRQVLHNRRDLKIVIFDPKGFTENSRWRVFYNGYNVTNQLVPQLNALDTQLGKEWTLDFKNIRIRPEKENFIQFVYYSHPQQRPIVQTWLPPECPTNEIQPVVTTENFTPSPHLMNKIDQWSKQHKINPSLLTGLIAQESAFNPRAISWAKAIGLTQITPLGDSELSRFFPTWPRTSLILKYPAPIVKALIASGNITAHEDWRLDPELSLRGGLTLLEYLSSYWKADPFMQQLVKVTPQAEQEQWTTQVLLASYQSGAARVKRALNERQQNFLTVDYLKAARKYVNRVSSYCYHFARKDDDHASTP